MQGVFKSYKTNLLPSSEVPPLPLFRGGIESGFVALHGAPFPYKKRLFDKPFSQKTLNSKPNNNRIGMLMFRQENPGLPPSTPSGTTTNKKVYVILAALAVIVVIVAALLIPQGAGSTMQLSLDYKVGEHMVYKTTNTVTNHMANTSISLPATTNSQSYNSTLTLDIITATSEGYSVNETINAQPNPIGHLPPFTLNISKTSYYNNFIAPGGPLIFYNTTNPTILAYLAQPTVKVGDTWKIPVNTGNASLGLSGEVTLTFRGIEDVTVPAGTYKTMRIEVTSSTLSVHSDGNSIIKLPQGMTLQLNGTSYVEQSTCRLIKTDLTQVTTTNSPGTGSTSTVYTEKTLIQHIKP